LNEPWKVRGILLLGLAVLACTLFAQEGWQVGLLVIVAIGFFVWGLTVASADPYDLQELELLEQKFGDVNIENKSAICPHCGEEYPAKRSVCPHCLRSP
jgi:hypothetical protein